MDFEVVNEPATEQDANLLRCISEGDRSAFARFYDQYSSLLFSIAIKILNDSNEAEDVLQEVFVQIWRRAGDYDARLGKPSSWVVTMTRNKAIDRIRASQRRARLIEQATSELAADPAPKMTANETVCGHENTLLIGAALADLPLDQRQAIELAFFRGLTQNEISEALKEPLGTIKARIRRGMLKLREKLGGLL